MEMEKVYNVYFITDGEISVLYSGQDTSKNYGVQFGVRQLPKNLIVCQIKNIKTYVLSGTNIVCADCELFIHGVWKEWSTKRQYIDDAIKFYENNNQLTRLGGYH
jgi:hypothetical protein